MKKSKINKSVIFTQPAKGGEQSIKTIKIVANMVVEKIQTLSGQLSQPINVIRN